MANKHTSVAGLIFAACFAVGKIGPIWFPAHAQQINDTVSALKELAAAYGFLMAGDSSGQAQLSPPNPTTTGTSTMKLIAIGLVTFGLLAATVQAQSNNAPGPVTPLLFTNAPTVALVDENVGISTGALMHGASAFDNSTLFDVTIKTNFFLRAEIESAANSSVVDAAGIGGGYCHTVATTRLYGFMEGRRNWNLAEWEGVAGLGVAYAPFGNSSNLLSGFSAAAEERLVVTRGGRPFNETFAGVRYSFAF